MNTTITKYIITPILLFISLSVGAQQRTMHGKVIDRATKEPIEDAVINDGQSGNYALTDQRGMFILSNVKSDSIHISLIGYAGKDVKTEVGKTITIEMEHGAVSLKDVVITSSAGSSTYHPLTLLDLNLQPVKSAQDLLRLVPGLFIAQHQGGGKAEQIFLRGFDADHGTDVNVSVDGIPVNAVSHAHGQGYADLHFLIPETVAGYDFGKGPYYSDKGDFTTAGYVAYTTRNVLDQNMVKIEAGQYNTARIVTMLNLLSEKAKKKGESAYIAAEGLYSDGGPFKLPEHFSRYNVFGKFNMNLNSHTKMSITASTLSSGWRSAGEIPNRAVADGIIPDRFGVIDSAQGGYTSRTNASIKFSTAINSTTTMENEFWYSHYYFNLVSNFSYYYYFPTTGDEFRQLDQRDMTGYNGKISKKKFVGNTSFTSTFGIGYRYDNIYPSALEHTENGNFIEYLQYGRTKELNANAYFDETVRKGKWMFNAALRLDYFHFYYQNLAPATDSYASPLYNGVDPNAHKSALSPKVNVEYTANQHLQFYFKAGKGFHSNDARVVIANRGYEVLPAAYGADLGVNWKPLPNLYINAALWYLYLDQEFTFGEDLVDQPGGPVSPAGKTSRKGIDFSARYQLTKWLFADVNANYADPKFIDSAAGHNYVPLAPTFTSTAALDFRFKNGINGGISYRYLQNRSANSDYSLTAQGYFITDLAVNYTQKRYEIGLSVENLFNQAWNESQFEYISQFKNETKPTDEVSYTPGVPFFAKMKVSVFF